MQYWQKVSTLGLNFPLVLVKLLQRKDQLRVLRENVMLIVRDYNNIMQLINKREANLFSNQLDILDAVINGGIKRCNWMSSADTFVIQSRNECQNTFDKIDQFKTSYSKITDEFERVSNTVLTKI
jgi:dynein heavy chain